MQLSLLKAAAFAVVFQTTSATPIRARTDGLDVVATTTTADGQVIDWVVPESQTGGRIAVPPPPPPQKQGQQSARANQAVMRALLGNDPAKQGPNGTVPVPRASGHDKAPKRLPTKADHGSFAKVNAAQDGYAGNHWYASSGQNVVNHGGKGTFSLFNAYCSSGADFSLLQTAVIRTNAAHAGTGAVTQTVEAGWINYPNQVGAPHLFSYFTTNGYSADGDNVGGWNRDHAGWVQTDASIYPGIAFSPLSVRGGAQYELEIGYYLTGGNWWLWCLDRYIGYYPASLFSKGVNAADTLADHSDIIDFYGEIYNSGSALTTTDMGSGEWPATGFGRSAYIHNILFVNTGNTYQDYNGQNQLVVSDNNRYQIAPTWSSGGSWGSFFYLGGPGAGGVIGA
ncbi:putative carboxyl-terminal proteinase [Rosellinia necatrix]|uniref:Putative carboxyl-terminal proteinase n=1 Tax=Rosellinia necatrix TaxID=77044 RepID=A0A1S7UIY9_ROSNE|nr:putative carboxyl-terminal proteinase [Rosellinia necatrix]